ncbi:MAG: tetratricopeptide repeat protein [Intestinibacter bartlettii]|uniref:tetratricopeptide repeat protein n=1 Tax=Intestinibacter bartlettii TaxID=261299 RepID=UPI0026EF0ADF|nr:tetratricopeptide repeat protein [Intestinibacter bartlettii]MDO5009426.1 tetratricopeptide repeat protein [Intestinibacter bartlettii]
MGDKIKRKVVVGLGGIVILASVIFSSIIIYDEVIILNRCSRYVELGNQYIAEENYKQAIEKFEDVLEIDNNSVEAIIGLSRSYIGMNNIDKAKEYILEAQQLDLSNEDLVLQILDIIPSYERKIVTTVLEKYIQEVGYENVSERFQLTVLHATRKSELNEYIKKAQDLYNQSSDTNDNEKTLKSNNNLLHLIDKSKQVNDGYFYTQEEVDEITETLKKAVIKIEGDNIQNNNV